jgi:hypothetical protein
LQKQGPEIKSKIQTTEERQLIYENPNVTISMTMRPNEEYRAVAKIAFETLALLRGAAFVLWPAFDPLREYIRGNVQLPAVAPGEVLVDFRFVQRLGQEFRLKFNERHGVLLLCSPPNLGAFGARPQTNLTMRISARLQWHLLKNLALPKIP